MVKRNAMARERGHWQFAKAQRRCDGEKEPCIIDDSRVLTPILRKMQDAIYRQPPPARRPRP